MTQALWCRTAGRSKEGALMDADEVRIAARQLVKGVGTYDFRPVLE